MAIDLEDMQFLTWFVFKPRDILVRCTTSAKANCIIIFVIFLEIKSIIYISFPYLVMDLCTNDSNPCLRAHMNPANDTG